MLKNFFSRLFNRPDFTPEELGLVEPKNKKSKVKEQEMEEQENPGIEEQEAEEAFQEQEAEEAMEDENPGC